MSSQFPHDQAWGNRSGASPLSQSAQQGGAVGIGHAGPPQGAWPTQYPPQSGYMPAQQQTYLNNNVAVKPSYNAPPPQNSWNRAPPQVTPFQQQPSMAYPQNAYQYIPQPANPQPQPTAFTNAPPNPYSQQPMFAPQPNYQPPPLQPTPPAPALQPVANDDPWSWGWEESSSDSPATSTPNNNWSAQQPVAAPSAATSVPSNNWSAQQPVAAPSAATSVSGNNWSAQQPVAAPSAATSVPSNNWSAQQPVSAPSAATSVPSNNWSAQQPVSAPSAATSVPSNNWSAQQPVAVPSAATSIPSNNWSAQQPVAPSTATSSTSNNWGVQQPYPLSASASASSNNWGAQQPPPQSAAFGSVHNYFQPGGAPPRPGPVEPSPSPSPNLVQEPKRDPSALTVENVAVVDSRSDGATVKSESLHSYQSGSTASEVKQERLSPDPGKIPLTTQALREFHKEVFENGPSAHRLGTEGLTPQWSIESQMSQETVSDDVSPSLAGGSDADSTPLPMWQEEPVQQQQQYTPRRHADRDQSYQPLRLEDGDSQFLPPRAEEVPQNYQPAGDQFLSADGERCFAAGQQFQPSRTDEGFPNYPPSGQGITSGQLPRVDEVSQNLPPPASERSGQFASVRTDLYPDSEVASRFSSLTLSEPDSENKEVISLEQQRAMNAAAGRENEVVDMGGRLSQNGFMQPPPRPEGEVGVGGPSQLTHTQGDGSSSPDPRVNAPSGPPLGGFKPTDKKSQSPRPAEIFRPLPVTAPPPGRPSDMFGSGRPCQYSPRPDGHSSPGQSDAIRQPDMGYGPPVLPTPAFGAAPPRPLDPYSYGPRLDEESVPPTAVPPRPLDSYNYSPRLPSEEAVHATPPPARPMESYNFPPRQLPTEDSVNLETIPDNKERPDLDMRRFPPPQHGAWYGSGPDNLEVAPRGDRNQYLETGQLADQDTQDTQDTLSGAEADLGESLPPPGLSRLVTGEGHNIDIPHDVATPPPGLDRMVLGQLTEGETAATASMASHGTPPPAGLHRMVLGQLTDEPTGFPRMVPGESSSPENQAQSPPPADPPRQRGYPRMVPGESSSPENPPQTVPVAVDSRDARIVPGVAREDAPTTTLPVPASPVGRRPSLSESPEQQGRNQPQAERCETIGSDHVEVFTANPQENSSKSSKRRDKERHREDLSSDERDSGRRLRDGDYYRDRDRDDSPTGDRRRVDWNRRRRQSPQRYRDYRDDRRRRRDLEYSDDEDADTTGGYYSDRERRNMSGHREDYDRTFPRRDDRARSLRPEKLPRDERREVKEKRRGYDRDRDRERDTRQSDYYRRRGHDEPDDFRDQRSRPSSRNDSSVHDFKHRGMSGRGETDRESERDHYRSHSKRDRDRDMYYPQGGGYNYDPALYSYYYQQYYENLRRTNPTAYAEYYRKYYASSHQGTYSEDRGSVHSGRSSANEETKERITDSRKSYGGPLLQQLHPYYRPQAIHIPQGPPPLGLVPLGPVKCERGLDTSLLPEEQQQPQRLTPTKFTTAHAKGILTPHGQLIKVLAHYPLDGQPATIEVHEALACYQAARAQLQDFPGPLVKGVSHKNNVVRYCKQKIKDADSNPDLFDKDSYKLIWELLILLLRQNGTVVGTDIAELLMAHRVAQQPAQPAPSPATSHHSINEIPGHQSLQEEEVTNKFRDLLIYGNTKEALEWAMKQGLWGHALFLASKMDQRTYASVMTRFANGLPMNDPLQTLYQLMSGRQPAAVTCCADERWGDWRPHLAMILSNPSGRPELDHRAIAALGDTLGARGALHAAHFCYLMAQLEFGSYAHKSSKLVLIGASHVLPFHLFATNEAIFATEIFEFACNLADTEFVLHHLQNLKNGYLFGSQVYKLLVARRLAEVGLTQEAVHYTEVIASTIMKQPSLYQQHFIQEVYDLGDMLKFSDPVYTSSDSGGNDPPWLQQLLPVLADYQAGVLQHHAGFAGSISNLTTCSDPDGQPSLPVDVADMSWQQPSDPTYPPQQQQQQYQQQLPSPPVQHQWQHEPQQHWQQEPQQSPQPESYGDQQQMGEQSGYGGSSTDTPNYWTPPPPTAQWQQPEDPSPSAATPSSLDPAPVPDYYDSSRSEAPTISLPGATPQRPRTTSQSSDSKRSAPQSQPPPSKEPPRPSQQGSGWLGGLWNKLSLRPKNQMILPDDKNPSILWDPDKKRWVDQNGEGDEVGGPPPPPPKAVSRPPVPAPAPALGAPSPANASASAPQAHPPMPPASGPNLYKMSRGKGLRANYIDVMNPGGKSQPPSTVPAPDLFPSLSYPSQPAKLFVPPPVEGQEGGMNLFSASSPSDSLHENRDLPPSQGLSRWSSTSSLSREVQKYTSRYTSRPSARLQGLVAHPDGLPSGQWNNGVIGGTLPRSQRSYK